jgi:uncharacterized membrane protein
VIEIVRRNWRWWLLVVSLLLNITLAGLLIGRLLTRDHPPPHDFVQRVTKNMSPADAQVMREAFKTVEEFRAEDEQGRAQIERSRTILQQPDFDAAAFAASLERASRGRSEFDRRFTSSLIEAAGKLSPAGRKTLATWRP